MNQGAAVALVLLAAVVAANLPFVNERIFVFGALVLGLGFLLEAGIGQRHPQGWEFYAAALCLFVTFAFPGFVWRYLRRHHG
jgi:hypothetical protein